MLRRLGLLFICFTLLFSFPCYASRDTTVKDSDLYARAAVLMDGSSGRVLYGKNEKTVLPMASTTKIMTCILLLEKADLSDYAPVSAYAASQPKVKLFANPSDWYRIEDLLYSLMLASHNDTAVILAEYLCGNTRDFALLMNQKAKEIGCTDTYFITPNGLDSIVTLENGDTRSHATTAVDLAKIMTYCVTKSPRKDLFIKITQTPDYHFTSYQKKDQQFTATGKQYHCTNHNAFLGMMDGVLSGKTGFTGNAGYCYVCALENDGRLFIVALLACGWPNNKSYKWKDTTTLMKYGIEQYQAHSISEFLYPKEQLSPVPVLNGVSKDVRLTVPRNTQDASFSLLLKEGERITSVCNVSPSLTAPVYSNQTVGHITYVLDHAVVFEEPILTTSLVLQRNFKYCFGRVLDCFLL